MNKLLLFAGTTEGREMAAWLDRQGVSAHVCVATEYGEALLMPEAGRHCIHRGRLTCDEMAELMRREGITHVVDATHPYAVDVSNDTEFDGDVKKMRGFFRRIGSRLAG